MILFSLSYPSEISQGFMIFIELMPKKRSRKPQYHKDGKKRRMRRALNERLKRLSRKEVTFKACDSEACLEPAENSTLMTDRKRKKIFNIRFPANFTQSMNYPLASNIVFTLYGMITIDQTTLREQTKDQSLIKALFNFYSLSEVQTSNDYLLIKFYRNKENHFPIPYIIERLKSFGDEYLYNVAMKIQAISLFFESIKMPTLTSTISEKQILQFTEAIKGKKAMLRMTPNILIFSRQLLELGGFSIKQIGQQCLHYRSFISDLFLADNYRGQINKFFELYELGGKLRRGEITAKEYNLHAQQRQVQYIINKHDVIVLQFKKWVKVVTNKSNIAPGVGCWEIETVIDDASHIEDVKGQIDRKRYFVEKRSARDLNSLGAVIQIPQNMKSYNKSHICSYKLIQGLAS